MGPTRPGRAESQWRRAFGGAEGEPIGASHTIAFNQPSARVFQIGTLCKLPAGARLVRYP